MRAAMPVAVLLLVSCAPAQIPPPDGGAEEDDRGAHAYDADAAHERDAAEGGDATTTATAPPQSSLRRNRDRLLDTYAASAGRSRCVAWGTMDAVQQGVFLTITDLLGKRTLTGTTSALDHVTRLHAVRGADSGVCARCCGGREFNRMFVSADAALIRALRASAGITEWRPSRDLAGPHAPFDQSAETSSGPPRGQSHYFSSPATSRRLDRPGVERVEDPSAVEIDIDYDVIHESNPLCDYGGEPGLMRYERFWSQHGTGGGAELDYLPSGC